VCQAKSNYKILLAQLSGVERGLGQSKGGDTDTAPGGLNAKRAGNQGNLSRAVS